MITPKNERTYCAKCKFHTEHKVVQAKRGKTRPESQGERKSDKKPAIIQGNAMPVFQKKCKTTKEVVMKYTCTICGACHQKSLGRSKYVEVTNEKKIKGI